MTIKLAVVMDAIQSINPEKDSTLQMLLEAQSRQWQVSYCQIGDILLQNGKPYAHMRKLSVSNEVHNWYILAEESLVSLAEFDVILMRKDPPFDINYLTCTYFLELAEQAGALVVNKPKSLRGANEKLATSWFPECCPPSLVTRRANDIRDFLETHQHIVIKPLNSMGGTSVFQIKENDENTSVIIETMTQNGQEHVMVQKYLPEIAEGDKRVLMIDGQPIPYALARIPGKGDFRGNLAKGASAKAMPLTEHEQWICERVGPQLQAQGLTFVGLDIIGNYLTEINVTSPTCIKELNAAFDLNIAGQLLDCIEQKLTTSKNL